MRTYRFIFIATKGHGAGGTEWGLWGYLTDKEMGRKRGWEWEWVDGLKKKEEEEGKKNRSSFKQKFKTKQTITLKCSSRVATNDSLVSRSGPSRLHRPHIPQQRQHFLQSPVHLSFQRTTRKHHQNNNIARMLQFELDEELLSLQDTVHVPGEIPIEGENPKALERILNGNGITRHMMAYEVPLRPAQLL